MGKPHYYTRCGGDLYRVSRYHSALLRPGTQYAAQLLGKREDMG